MKKFFYVVILFFIFTINVNAEIFSGTVVNCPMGGATHGLVYNTNGGNSIETTMFCSACFHEDTSLPIPVKSGYDFDGWYYDSSFKQKVETNNIKEVKYTQLYDEHGCIKYTEVNLYAKWVKLTESEVVIQCPVGGATYGIIYNTNGGNKIEDYVHCSGCLPKDVLLPTPTRKGYEFVGWYYDSSFKKKVTAKYANKITYTQLYNEHGCIKYTEVNLYAKWKKIKTTVDKDDDTSQDDPSKKEDVVKCPDNVPLYLIKYNSNGGNVIPDYSYCENCVEDVLLPIPVKDGYEFVGWYYDYEFQNLVSEEYANKIKYNKSTDSNGCVVQTEITLYAKWNLKPVDNPVDEKETIEENAIVVYHTDGGSLFTDDEVCISCAASTLLDAPVKNGYEFAGWYYDKHFINKVNVKYLEDLSDVFTDKTDDETIINIYAKWKAVKSTDNDEQQNIYGILAGIIIVLVIITVIVVSRKKKDNYYNY